MTRIGRRLIEDFLLPALNDGRYSDLLKWINKEDGVFSIRWSHKNAAKWTLDDTIVFQDWDKLKGRYRPEQKGYYMQAKQRFRAALYKLNTVEQIDSEDKCIKKYRLRLDPNKKHDSSRKLQKVSHKGQNQKSIPTPVICKNTYGRGTELVGRDYLEDSSSSSSASPYSIKSEDCDPVQEKIDFTVEDYQEYQRALKRQRKQSSPNHYPQVAVKTEISTCETSVLRESPQINMVRKTPHVPIQPVPVYNKATSRQAIENLPKQSVENSQNQQAVQNIFKGQAMENFHPRVESPSILLVPTYNTPPGEDKLKVIDAVSFLISRSNRLKSEQTQNDEHKHNSDGVLNLSVKPFNETQLLCR